MTSDVTFTFELKGLRKFGAIMKPELYRRLSRQHIGRATAQNAVFAAAAMRKVIQSGENLDANAPLTEALKGANKPLVGLTATLWQAITHKKINTYEAFAGLLRTEEAFNIGVIVHDGVAIPVTDKMRGMFFYLWLASEGQISSDSLEGRAAELFQLKSTGWAPLKDDTEQIVIPERPFVDIAMRSERLRSRMEQNWQRALGFVFRDMKRQFMSGKD